VEGNRNRPSLGKDIWTPVVDYNTWLQIGYCDTKNSGPGARLPRKEHKGCDAARFSHGAWAQNYCEGIDATTQTDNAWKHEMKWFKDCCEWSNNQCKAKKPPHPYGKLHLPKPGWGDKKGTRSNKRKFYCALPASPVLNIQEVKKIRNQRSKIARERKAFTLNEKNAGKLISTIDVMGQFDKVKEFATKHITQLGKKVCADNSFTIGKKVLLRARILFTGTTFSIPALAIPKLGFSNSLTGTITIMSRRVLLEKTIWSIPKLSIPEITFPKISISNPIRSFCPKEYK
jgi:hypothetical protein